MTKFSLISKTLCAASVACFISLQVFAQTPVTPQPTPTPGSPTQPPQTQPPQPEQIQPSQPVQPGQNPQTIQPGQNPQNMQPGQTPRSVPPGQPMPMQPMKGDTIHPDSTGMGMTGWQKQNWVKDLSLTPEQQARFKKLDDQYAATRPNPNATKAEKEQMWTNRSNEYRAILTPDQVKKYDEMMATKKEMKKEMKQDRKMEGKKSGKKDKTMPMDTTGNKPVPQQPKQ